MNENIIPKEISDRDLPTKKGEWQITETDYAVQIAQWGNSWISVLCEIPKLPYSDKGILLSTAFKVCTAVNEYDKLKEENGLMEIELRNTKTLLASCENALISRNEDNAALLDALNKIEKWEMPVTGQFWDREEKQPMSYSACYGSNGERDYIKSIAKAAIQKAESK